MRRLLAITVVVALVFSTGLPIWATACTATNQDSELMCHRTAARHHHCESMAGRQQQADGGDAELILPSQSDGCPMQCCLQLQAGNGVAVLAIVFLPELAVAEYRVDSLPIAFISSGFSSHTDRGPPSV